MGIHLSIERLRHSLMSSRMPNIEVQQICESAQGDINEALLTLVTNAITEAIDYAISIGADDFINDVQVISNFDNLYQISTHSGNLDYSKEEVEMLPSLLKNAKVSQDGHRYKVIPMQKKEKVEHSMFSVLQSRQDMANENREALRSKAGIAAAIRANLTRQTLSARAGQSESHIKTGEVQFRTATDKQDPSKSWVIPAKPADMSQYIEDLNMRISQQSYESVDSIINYYYSSYVGA